MKLMNKKGFTLIELICVISIMAVLSGMAMLDAKGATSGKEENIARADVLALQGAVDRYRIDMGTCPANITTALTTASGGKGPWMNRTITTDPWGTTYQYDRSNGYNCFVYSNGKNKSRDASTNPLYRTVGGDDIGAFN